MVRVQRKSRRLNAFQGIEIEWDEAYIGVRKDGRKRKRTRGS